MTTLWKKKLAAWLHDPAEKALVLMRDVDNKGQRIGHESGSVADLRKALGIAKADFDKRADHYAAAADRPQWPCEDGRSRPGWANVRFVEQPVLIHPLSGEALDLGKLNDIEAARIREASLEHFSLLIERDAAGQPDMRLTQLAFWRFGPEPELVAKDLGALWRLLPADTRVPDHTIWQHLDVVSALSGAMDDDSAPALLTMSFGPVQGFIAQARSTSDLWAGSHLLSSLVWEGLEVICRTLGPDAVLFPNLRGVAAVDRWLLEQAPHWRERFERVGAPFLGKASDANPLFAATLPNKFMAIVPAAQAQALAQAVTDAVRQKALQWATEAAEIVFAEAHRDVSASAHWRQQVTEQLHGFPELHWGCADWPVAEQKSMADSAALQAALHDHGTDSLFGEPVWQVLNKSVELEGVQFFKPNAGILYPAVYELAERSLAAAKALRPFQALPQEGYRCTLTGEHEWLTDDSKQLMLAPEPRKGRSVWAEVVGRFGIKQGEHLGAVATLKRLWPTLFTSQVREFLDAGHVKRYVVSTHTMALATSLGRLIGEIDGSKQAQLGRLLGQADAVDPVVLPASLARQLLKAGLDETSERVIRRLPSLLDQDGADEDGSRIGAEVQALFGQRPETYYGLIMMDGDRMGAWMAGNETEFQRKFPDTWHPQVRHAVAQKFGHLPAMQAYLGSYRPASPARHAAISAVLNDFSTHVARHVVEEVFKGKLLYAGGDDVLAMVSVDDLLPCMLLLRATYSGVGDLTGLPALQDLRGLALGRGHVGLRVGAPLRLMPMMGMAATASIGAVVAHHQAPLSAVLRSLRAAEKQAKNEGGRNAFCLKVLKRSGGALAVCQPFWDQAQVMNEQAQANSGLKLAETPLGLLQRFAEAMALSDMSRRAVYNASEWLAGLPPRPLGGQNNALTDAEWQAMVGANLAMQFTRQKGLTDHAHELVKLACDASQRNPAQTAALLTELLHTAEFFAREGRFTSRGAA